MSTTNAWQNKMNKRVSNRVLRTGRAMVQALDLLQGKIKAYE